MMSIGQVGPAGKAGDYYTHQDNYYVLGSMDERWVGQGAEALGLSGKVDVKDFVAVLEGKLPDGSDLTRMVGGENKHRPGYDLTFSAPKSVSIMAMLGGDKRLIAAHNHAVEVAVREVEKLASTRSMTEGVSETRLTGNLVVALFNHDTSRDLDPQMHTHAVVANVTQHDGKWQTLSSDTVGKTGFIESVYANQVAFGQIYRHVLRQDTEAMGYQTENVGPHGMWEFKGMENVIDVFSKRNHAIDAAAGPDASLKSRDMATLDTRKAKVASDPAALAVEWLQEMKSAGFDAKAYLAEAQSRTMVTPSPTPLEAGGDALVDQAVGQAISALSDRQVNFTHNQVANKAISYLSGEPGMLDAVRDGIDRAIEREQLIPLDKEKGVFTSDIHLLDELSVAQLSRTHLDESAVVTGAPKADPRTGSIPTYSDAVQTLAQHAPAMAVLSGMGGASVNRSRVAEVVELAREQGRDATVLTVDRQSQQYLQQSVYLDEGHVVTRAALGSEALFAPNSTLVVDQAEKLTLKETVALLDGAVRNNVQLVLMDTEKRKGTGNALAVMKEAGVPRYQFSGRQAVPAEVVSEPDKAQRFGQLAKGVVQALVEDRSAVAQVNGPAEQRMLTAMIRDELKDAGLLGREETPVATLTPVWLDSKNRGAIDTYREGMVMERWDAESRQRERFVIDRVGAQTRNLVLRNAEGEKHTLAVKAVDKDWSLFRAGTMGVADGERLRVLGQEGRGKDALKAGTALAVVRAGAGELQVRVAGEPDATQKPADRALAVGSDVFSAVKVAPAYVESLGASVSSTAAVYAAVKKNELNSATLSGIARSGGHITLYSALDARKTQEKVAQHPAYRLAGEQVKQLAGEEGLDAAIAGQKSSLFTPAQQAIHLAIPTLEGDSVAFGQAKLLAGSLGFAAKGVSMEAIQTEIEAQVKRGELLKVDVAPGVGADLLVSRASFEAEKSIIRLIADGKDSLPPLVTTSSKTHNEDGPGQREGKVAPYLTQGQRQAVDLILNTTDRFVAIQGYAGVGKTTQFKAVLDGIAQLPESERPRVVGLAPTHRAVGEMQAAGVDAQTLASFLHDEGLKVAGGEKPDYRNTLFVVDESSMVGNSDMARTYALIAEGNGRAVMSGDEAQLEAIAPGAPFRLAQGRSAIDMAVMKEIVRQTPELKPAVYKMIENDVPGALDVVRTVAPANVPRQADAWVPAQSVVEYPAKGPDDIHAAIVSDYLGRTEAARRDTLIITHLNADRHIINAGIHQERKAAGELKGESVSLPILESANIRDGELRKMDAWARNRDAVVLLDSTYYRMAGIDSQSRTVSLQDSEGNTRQFSPASAVREGVTLYNPRTIEVSVGDRMRFSKSDVERGHVANSVWTVEAIKGDMVTLSDGQQTRTVNPREQQQDRHVDLAYAITAHGAQGASERFAITLEGGEGGREPLVNRASAYVALSRAKEHVQVYTDNEAGWLNAIGKAKARTTAHDAVLGMAPGSQKAAADLYGKAVSLSDNALGRAVLRGSQLTGDTLAHYVSPGKKYPQPHAMLPMYDANGKPAGAWLAPLADTQGKSVGGLPTQGRVFGSDSAQFVALQGSRNNETRLAGTMQDGIRLAARYPDSGVVVRLQGDDVPFNPQAMTGGRVWVNDETLKATARESGAADSVIKLPETPEERLQRELRTQADKLGREPNAPDPQRLAGLNDEQLRALFARGELRAEDVKARLPAAVMREVMGQDAALRVDAAVRQVAREPVSTRSRLQQDEQNLVRDTHPERELNKEKTLGGD
ncbi:conjugative transfer relaxase/helicase TraI [Serratia marcescens]|uniref:conjugative transfer relaxase/helicase TraI n=1 Tax=Serratia marcescens TaxID=615 RepID=UPI0004E35145|nr:conjugative transfer relaxase/helicase TraI [Serratia marcescens]KFD17765.1 TraI family DNA-nicking and unwinding protein [Serratia marcescens subsp. marcescens ATCC 13880]KFL05896.1 conjugative transfer relaxase protein TraI [Serratia marcescens]MCC3252088.1 conjugative transfer relaxase/helicase TraI [Serratia marcescens]PNU42410.1 conjugative transfer relaxase/helicase TraI [Serratia marcescens subsp. marcescens ATCC 13880]QSO60246.1 conjugative transfer relaxase/helicase TraI [Serratia 